MVLTVYKSNYIEAALSGGWLYPALGGGVTLAADELTPGAVGRVG